MRVAEICQQLLRKLVYHLGKLDCKFLISLFCAMTDGGDDAPVKFRIIGKEFPKGLSTKFVIVPFIFVGRTAIAATVNANKGAS